MIARSFFLRFLAWADGMAAVLVVNAALHQVQGGGVLNLRVLARVSEIGVGGQLQLIIAFAAFAAAIHAGARGASWRAILPLGLVVAAASLVLEGYTIPLIEWAAWHPHHVHFATWSPLRLVLPAGAWIPPDPGSVAAKWEPLTQRAFEAWSLLAAVLTFTGAVVGRYTATAREPLRRYLLPWSVAIALFASTRVWEWIVSALAMAAIEGPWPHVSPFVAGYSLVSVPLAVFGTLLWVRLAESGGSLSGSVEP